MEPSYVIFSKHRKVLAYVLFCLTPFQFLQGRPPKLDYCHKNMSFIELTWTILIQMSFHMKTIKIKKGFSEFDVACIVLTLESNICSSFASYSSSCDTSNDN